MYLSLTLINVGMVVLYSAIWHDPMQGIGYAVLIDLVWIFDELLQIKRILVSRKD